MATERALESVRIATREEWLAAGYVVKPGQRSFLLKDVEHYTQRQVEKKIRVVKPSDYKLSGYKDCEEPDESRRQVKSALGYSRIGLGNV